MKHKIISLVSAVAMATSLMSAPLIGSAEENVTLHMWIWDEEQRPAMQAMVDEFEEMYPNISVEISVTPGSGDYNIKMNSVAGTSDAPEIFWMNFNLAKEYIPMGFVQDLTDYIESDDSFDISGLNAGILENYTVDGRIYGIPKDTDSFAVFYNKQIFDEAGVAYPESDWTINDFIETAKELTSDGIVGWSNSTADRVCYNFMYAYGGSPYTEDGMPNVNSEECVEAVQMLMDMMDDGYALSYADLAEIGADSAFESGIAAMDIQGSWMLSEFYNAFGDNLGIVELPSGPAGIGSCGHGIAWATTTENEHMDETILLLSYLATDEAQAKQAEVVIPAATNVADEWEEVYPDLNLSAFINMLDYNVSYLTDTNATAVRSAFQEYMTNTQSGMYENAQEAMDAAQEAMLKAMED